MGHLERFGKQTKNFHMFLWFFANAKENIFRKETKAGLFHENISLCQELASPSIRSEAVEERKEAYRNGTRSKMFHCKTDVSDNEFDSNHRRNKHMDRISNSILDVLDK